MAGTLKELIELATKLLEEYGDAPLDAKIYLDEIPGDCHRAFVGTETPHAIEVCTESLPFRV